MNKIKPKLNLAAARVAATVAVLAAALLVGACGGRDAQPPAGAAATPAADSAVEHARKHMNPKYRCPMHPQIVREAPGNCPICGMQLTLVPGQPPQPRDESDGTAVRISAAVENNLGVRTEPARREALVRRLDTVGYVAFDERNVRQVRPRAEGWVATLHVHATGEAVRAGQPLYTLYSPMLETAQQEYRDARQIGNAELIEASRDRLVALGLDPRAASRSGNGSGRVTYVSPIDGVVTALDLREGSMVTPEMPAVTVNGIGSLWVMAEVPEAQSGWLAAGTAAEIAFPSLPGERVSGRVDYVYPELDAETRTVRARIVLDDVPASVRPNMLAQVLLAGAAGPEAVTVPRGALIRTGDGDRVVIALGDGRYAPRRVTAGATAGDRVEIREGLAAGETVVVAGQFLLDSEASLGAGLDRLGATTAEPAGDPHAAH